ncbi:T9SS type A sorting domain-containing protein [Winogradskyella immobilis]|uniref:T9SS type A sorting domain-containing protein n=1 Tax=Winogradskyella immobilis TaxID=2816852 RepID=A0ABS8EL57_9FLAO|nr:T9SS type A sorting domain-containing protein [Winogradskyella immobilis]MCC1483577.1 T9SS type A sorting domain-containing protein [Winogradskyella immobilis]MCG0015671.1 T9SS type A sorting domain-containing protein [Winogradskyella immobilis]
MKTKLLVLLLFIGGFSSFAQSTTRDNIDIINSQNDKLNEFSISPNPSKRVLNIEFSKIDNDLRLEVYDVLGKRVHKAVLNQLKTTINVTNWKSGVYLVRLSNDKTSLTKRFIKQ